MNMNIVFVSNFYNHHQKFVSKNLYKLTGGNYKFIVTEKMPEERKNLGYDEEWDDFVYSYEENPEKVKSWIDTCDIVIIGSAPEFLLKQRKRERKIIFRYSERPLKNGLKIWKYPLQWIKWHLINPKKSPIYMLCASAYTAEDYRRYGLFMGKTYKWGYFPEYCRYESPKVLLNNKNKKELLWCGRFLDWKHPDDALKLATKLKEANYDFHINIIGAGDMEDALRQYCRVNGLENCISFLGSMDPSSVRSYMERAGIFLFTSDKKEGWGAVLNEAMNSGCAVIASDSAGSTRFLVEHNINGYRYQSGDLIGVFEYVKHLLDDHHEQHPNPKEAYKTIAGEWNPEEAANRIFKLAEVILQGNVDVDLYEVGPCSKI